MDNQVFHPQLIFTVGLILVIVEIFTPTNFVFIFFGVSAFIIGILSYFIDFTASLQIISWLIFGILLCFNWFVWFKPMFDKKKTNSGLGASVIIGETGIIVATPFNGQTGKVRFAIPISGSDEWPCRSEDQINIGDRVIVKDVIGNELLISLLK